MSGEPFTHEEWERVAPTIGLPTYHGMEGLRARIEATFERGLQPSPPTPYELDEWAARKIMGWIQTGATWAKPADTIAGFRNIIDMRDWKPSVDLGQALECLAECDVACELSVGIAGAAYVEVRAHGRSRSGPVFNRPYDAAAMAEAIMRKLHAEVGS